MLTFLFIVHIENASGKNTSDAQEESTQKPPVILNQLKFLSGIHVTTVQTMVVMEMGSGSKSCGLQLSVEKVTGGVIFKQGASG